VVFFAACGAPDVAGPDWTEPATPTTAPRRSPPRLQVDGAALRDASGNEVRLRGLNVCSLEFDNAGANWQLDTTDGGSVLLDALADPAKWNANVVRMPVNQEWFVTDDAYVTRVEQLIDAAALRGLYVLLDVQWENAERTDPYYLNILKHPTFGFGNTTEAFWHRASGRFSNRDNLLFDIINEPHDVKPEELARGLQKMLDRLAQRAPRTPVVVSGPDWAQCCARGRRWRKRRTRASGTSWAPPCGGLPGRECAGDPRGHAWLATRPQKVAPPDCLPC
jgi:hypothetical protein